MAVILFIKSIILDKRFNGLKLNIVKIGINFCNGIAYCYSVLVIYTIIVVLGGNNENRQYKTIKTKFWLKSPNS